MKKSRYVTYFEVTVQGLNIDSEVKYRGVRVGRVTDIMVAPDGHLIEVVMELDPKIAVPDSMRAKVELTGITGMKYIELDFVGPEMREMHPKLSFKPPYPVIPSYPGGFEQIEQALRDIYDKIIVIDTEGISHSAKRFLDTGTMMMNDADSLIVSIDMTKCVNKLEKTIENVDSMLLVLNMQTYDAGIQYALVEFRLGAESFRALCESLNEQADGMNLDNRVEILFNETEMLFTSMHNMIQVGTELLYRTQYETSQVMSDLRTAVSALTEAIENMNSIMLNQEAYPSNILYTAPPSKEK
ncbi:MCE family protein [bacterium]|nr:MCE family protein [bacterium]